MRLLKTVHGWLGVIILPWVIMIGLTGLFLNHEALVTSWLDGSDYDEAQFDAWPGATPLSVDAARGLAGRLYPGVDLVQGSETAYHGRDAAIFDADGTRVIVALATGHYWIKTDVSRLTHAPDGSLLERKIYWEGIFKRLHVRGWLSGTFGTWLADITAAAMVVFGLSGIVLFLVPRLRRRQNRRRMRAAEAR